MSECTMALLLGTLLGFALISLIERWLRWRTDRKRFERETLERWYRYFAGRTP